LAGKAKSAQNAQRVVAKRFTWLKRGAQHFGLKVFAAAKRIQQLAPGGAVHAHGHRVNAEVAAALVVLKGSGLNRRLARLASVAFCSGLHKFNLPSVPRELGRAKILVDRYFTRLECGCSGLGDRQRIPYDHKVYVLRILAVH